MKTGAIIGAFLVTGISLVWPGLLVAQPTPNIGIIIQGLLWGALGGGAIGFMIEGLRWEQTQRDKQ